LPDPLDPSPDLMGATEHDKKKLITVLDGAVSQ
jgi:hypothetical protein